jgi:hypothetical protein
MNEFCDCRCSAGIIIDPQPLKFGRPQVKDGQLSYQAVVPLPPSDALFRLTVSTTIPDVGKEDSEQELRFLLAGLRADFFLTSPRDEDEYEDEDEPDPDPDYLDWQINITPELVAAKLSGEYGVVFVVQAPIPVVSEYGVDTPSQPPSVRRPMVPVPTVPPTNISKRTRHVYWSASGQAIQPTVTSDMNTVYIYPGNIRVKVNQSRQVSRKTREVTIINRSYRRPAIYEMNLSWQQVIESSL